MDDPEELWQRRIRELYDHVEELYSHVDISVVVFDRQLAEVSARDSPASEFAPPLAEIARRVLDTGQAHRDVPLDQIGRRRAHGYPIRDASGSAGVVCIVDDDGARRELFVRCAMAIFDGYRQNEAALLERERRALDEAQRANRLRDQFLAMVAHELKSPMASVLLWQAVLREPSVDSDTRIQALDAIHDAAAGQAPLIDDLLDISRVINGKLRVERTPTSIGRVLTTAVATARRLAESRHLTITSDFDEELGDVLGDSRRLRQVFENMLSNAIKCTAHGGISVRARRGEDSITIEVSDTGRGINPEFLPHVFEAFRQSDDRPPGVGLGLGLAIARELVELHEGTISAASAGEGLGATFTVTLPRVREALPEEAARQTIAGVRVLLIDDDAQIADALKILLGARRRRRGNRILRDRRSPDPRAAPHRHRGERHRDARRGWLQPGGTLRETPGPTGALPAIAITANDMETDRQRALAAGFDRYLTKPIDLAR